MARLHDDEVAIDEDLARDLIAEQFPTWSTLPLEPIDSSGTVNVIFRLGADLTVRLPRAERFQEPETSCWLHHLAGRLPLPIPEPVAVGAPTECYPLQWTVHRWINGEPWRLDLLEDPCEAAEQLAELVHALHSLDPGASTCPPLWDGGTFQASDPNVRLAAPHAPGVDADAVLRAWDDAMRLEAYEDAPVLIHNDLLPGNVLVEGGHISAVIDWGALAAGDPSRDLLPTWTLFDGPSRQRFRDVVGGDDATWARARGAALAFVVGVAYYAESNPVFADQCRSTLRAALDEPATR